jgi:transglutaminase-like putative cysteine protease
MFHGKAKRSLLRVECKDDPIEGVQLPPLILWLDEQLEPVRAQTQLPIGQVTLYRTTKADATQGGSSAALADIGFSQVIKLNRKIVNPFAVKKADYRVTIQGMENPAQALAPDLRQTITKVKADTFELHISAGPSGTAEKIGDEFLQSSYFINTKDPVVKKLAHSAVGTEKDPWKKALKIEKWVNHHMTATNDEAMTPADQVARTLQGDCSEYAMLMTALCRAEGVPARTAMGLIYTDLKKKGPVFSFHMWTEVWIADEWRPLDATLGRGGVGATHIKITDHSWHDTHTLTPVLPLYNMLGKLSIEVLRVEY